MISNLFPKKSNLTDCIALMGKISTIPPRWENSPGSLTTKTLSYPISSSFLKNCEKL